MARAKTYWRLGSMSCSLFTGDGTFELRLTDGEFILRSELCRDSSDAFNKSKAWHRAALRSESLT